MNAKKSRITIQKEIIAEDAMSRKSRLTISFPTDIGDGLDAVLQDIQKLSENHAPRSISSAKKRLDEMPPPAADDLSANDFCERAQGALDAAGEAITNVPKKYHEAISHALNQAFLAGSLLTEEFLRSGHLNDVEREAAQKEARRKGGESKRGQVKKDTSEIVRVMQELIFNGKSKSSAAALALKRGLGTSVDANRKIYDYHIKRK